MAKTRALAKQEAVSALGVVASLPIQIAAPTFQGSLAQLFLCVRERRIDLRDIPLAPICESYFEYLLSAPDANLEEGAAALTALAYMLERKAWSILPRWEEQDPSIEEPMELPDPSVHEFDLAIQALEKWQQERASKFFRAPGAGPDVYEIPYVLADVALADLASAFERLLSRASPEPIEPLSRPRSSIADGMAAVLRALTPEPRSLTDLLLPPYTRSEAVLWFLALLELIRLGQVAVTLAEDEPLFARAH